MRTVLATRISAVALLLALVVGLADAYHLIGRAIGYRYPLDYGEGPLLDQAVRLTQGRSLYPLLDAAPPWTVSNYPPLYPLFEAAFAGLVGPAYWYGRLLSALGFAGAAIMAGLIVHTLTGDRRAALVAGALLPVIPFVRLWSTLGRIDGPALAFSLAGLWCVVRRPDRHRALVAGILLMAAAAFTRQTYLLAAPLTAFCWVWGVRRRRALIFALGLAGVVAVAGLALTVASRGGFWFDVVTANVNAFSWSWVLSYALFTLALLPVLVATGLVMTVLAIRRRDDVARVFLPYLIGASAVAVTVGKVGSGWNYLAEISVAGCLGVGFLLARWRDRPLLQTVVAFALVAQIGWVLVRHEEVDAYDLAFLADSAGTARLADVVAAADGPVLADQDIGLLPLAGRPIELQPFELTQLALAGHWDPVPVVRAVEAGTYPVVLIYTTPYYPGLELTRWPPAVLDALHRRYVVAERIERPIGVVDVYRPR